MLKSKNIIRFILVLLLLLGGNKREMYSYTLTDNFTVNTLQAPLPGKTTHSLAFINNHSLKKEWIKVRYMGGDCSYDAIIIPIINIVPQFIDNPKETNYSSFISSSHSFLFKLRGPPKKTVA